MLCALGKLLTNDNVFISSCNYLAFPYGCLYYFGPHSVGCLENVWKGVGCLAEGASNPAKLSLDELEPLMLMNLQ